MTKSQAVVLFTIAVLALSSSAPAQTWQEPSPSEVRQAYADYLHMIEGWTGLDATVSSAVADTGDPTADAVFSKLGGSAEFVASVYGLRQKAFNATALAKTLQNTAMAQSSSNEDGYPPAYPFPERAPTGIVLALDLISDVDGRCGGGAYDVLEGVVGSALQLLINFEAACTVAGCDPSGVGCAAACLFVETYKRAYEVAKIPIDACSLHNETVDSAEIEADYENGLTLLSKANANSDQITDLAMDLSEHDLNIDGDLAAHDQRVTEATSKISNALGLHDTNIDQDLSLHDQTIKSNLASHDLNIANRLAIHDTDMKALLASVLANQLEIIKLLKTPEGKRPGWNRDGY